MVLANKFKFTPEEVELKNTIVQMGKFLSRFRVLNVKKITYYKKIISAGGFSRITSNEFTSLIHILTEQESLLKKLGFDDVEEFNEINVAEQKFKDFKESYHKIKHTSIVFGSETEKDVLQTFSNIERFLKKMKHSIHILVQNYKKQEIALKHQDIVTLKKYLKKENTEINSLRKAFEHKRRFPKLKVKEILLNHEDITFWSFFSLLAGVGSGVRWFLAQHNDSPVLESSKWGVLTFFFFGITTVYVGSQLFEWDYTGMSPADIKLQEDFKEQVQKI